MAELPAAHTWEATGIPWGDGETDTLAVTAAEYERVTGEPPPEWRVVVDMPGRFHLYHGADQRTYDEEYGFRGEVRLTITTTPVREIDYEQEFGSTP